MSEPTTKDRPRQLTMAAGCVVAGSVFLVLSVFDTVSRLNSVAMREQVVELLRSGSMSGLGLSVDGTLSLMRIGLTVAAVCAAAAAVLGVYAFQRRPWVRTVLSVLAVPLLITSPLTGGLFGALVVVATMTMWTGPARDWYAGRPVRELTPMLKRPDRKPPEDTTRREGSESGGSAAPAPAPVPSLSTTQASTRPDATRGFGAPPPAPQQEATAQALPATQAGAEPVPPGVRIACISTWVFSGIAALMTIAAMVVLVVDPEVFVRPLVESPSWEQFQVPRETVVPSLWLLLVMGLGWALAACVLAGFTWRRHDWARWLLAFSAGFALVVALATFPIGMLHQLGCGVTIAGLFNAASRSWFDRAR